MGQNRVPHTWLLNTGPGGFENRASDFHQLSGVAQMNVLHGLMSQENITMSMIYLILESREYHTKRLTEMMTLFSQMSYHLRWLSTLHHDMPL
jgi:hypothetical protein